MKALPTGARGAQILLFEAMHFNRFLPPVVEFVWSEVHILVGNLKSEKDMILVSINVSYLLFTQGS